MRALLVTLFAAGTLTAATPQVPPKAVSRVTVAGEHFAIPEARASFTIPTEWLKWAGSFRIDSNQLSTVQKDAVGAEWDSAYGPIADAILPFADCLLQIGNDGWGRGHSTTFADVQMRVYLTDLKIDEISKRVAAAGVQAASGTKAAQDAIKMTGMMKGKPANSDSKDNADWRIDHIGVDLFYGDYGGGANLYLYSRSSGSKTLVFVFMMVTEPPSSGTPSVKVRDSIIGSVKIEK